MKEVTTTTKRKQKKVAKEKSFFKINDMVSLLYSIKLVILAFVSGILLGMSLKLEQLQMITVKSIVYGVFVFLLFDVMIYYVSKFLKKRGDKNEKSL